MTSWRGTCRSNHLLEFVGHCGKREARTYIDPQFAMASPQVLDTGLSPDHDARDSVSFEASHRSKSGLESSVVSFDSIIGVLGGVVKCSRQEVGNDSYRGMGRGR